MNILHWLISILRIEIRIYDDNKIYGVSWMLSIRSPNTVVYRFKNEKKNYIQIMLCTTLKSGSIERSTLQSNKFYGCLTFFFNLLIENPFKPNSTCLWRENGNWANLFHGILIYMRTLLFALSIYKYENFGFFYTLFVPNWIWSKLFCHKRVHQCGLFKQ